MTKHFERECAELGRELSGLAAELVMRVEAAMPADCRTCRELLEQWRDSLTMGLKHAENDQAREYSDAAFRLIMDELRRHGIHAV